MATTPEKWLRAVTVIVDVAETPALTAAGEVALMVKSWSMKVAVAPCTSDVLVPVMARV